MKPKIVVVAAIPRTGLIELEEKFDLIYPSANFMFSEEELKKHLTDAVAALTVFIQPFRADLYQHAAKLKIIANYGVGYNNIDVPMATRMGIVVCNTPNAVTEPTAELAFGLLLSLTRKIALTDRHLRMNPDFRWGMMENLGSGIFGKTVGIIGMGRIGQSFARRAIASGMQVVYYNRTRLSPEIEAALGCRHVSMNELLGVSDVISVHCPLTNETHHLLDEKAMLQMKDGVILINTARGAIIDEQMLVKYLQNGKLGGAGLDVFEAEPLITPALLGLDQVVLTPHNGTGTIDTRIDIAREAARNILGFFSGQRNISIVNPEVWK